MDKRLLFGAGLLLFTSALYARQRFTETESEPITDFYQPPIFEPDPIMTNPDKVSRGERNNNPGNIVKSDIFWRGEIVGNDSRFESFDSPQDGIRAIARVLSNYRIRYGLNTVRGLINRYAPPVENDTNAYVNAVARQLNVSPDAPIDVLDSNTLFALVRAIIQHENGRIAYSDSMIAEAVALA